MWPHDACRGNGMEWWEERWQGHLSLMAGNSLIYGTRYFCGPCSSSYTSSTLYILHTPNVFILMTLPGVTMPLTPLYGGGFRAEGAAFRLSGSAVFPAFLVWGDRFWQLRNTKKFKSFLETSRKLPVGVGFEPQFPLCPCPLVLNWPRGMSLLSIMFLEKSQTYFSVRCSHLTTMKVKTCLVLFVGVFFVCGLFVCFFLFQTGAFQRLLLAKLVLFAHLLTYIFPLSSVLWGAGQPRSHWLSYISI